MSTDNSVFDGTNADLATTNLVSRLRRFGSDGNPATLRASDFIDAANAIDLLVAENAGLVRTMARIEAYAGDDPRIRDDFAIISIYNEARQALRRAALKADTAQNSDQDSYAPPSSNNPVSDREGE